MYMRITLLVHFLRVLCIFGESCAIFESFVQKQKHINVGIRRSYASVLVVCLLNHNIISMFWTGSPNREVYVGEFDGKKVCSKSILKSLVLPRNKDTLVDTIPNVLNLYVISGMIIYSNLKWYQGAYITFSTGVSGQIYVRQNLSDYSGEMTVVVFTTYNK